MTTTPQKSWERVPKARSFAAFAGSLVALAWAAPAAEHRPVLPTATVQVSNLATEVLRTLPHDTGSYTQGLLLHNGSLFESAGQYGRSSLREVDPATGEVRRETRLDREYFAEGLTRVEDRLIQLTWQEETAFAYDLATFERVATFTYEGEGWGLCFGGDALYMSDGGSSLTRRDPTTFAPLAEVPVTLRGDPVPLLNELECVGGSVYANVYTTNYLVQIDKLSGQVVAVINTSGLLSEAERSRLAPDAVLNGVAYNPETRTFFLTGKLWPKVFEVRFVAE